jgi:hypothetical protein
VKNNNHNKEYINNQAKITRSKNVGENIKKKYSGNA